MKILSLNGSLRKAGNTGRIISLIEKRLMEIADEQGVPIEIERLDIGHANVRTCRGCRVCFDAGEEKCPLKDDVLEIREKMREADAIIAASPVYVEDVSGAMKNFLDRLAFICHRPEFSGKTVYIVTTSGGGSTNHAANTLKRAFSVWGVSYIRKSKFRTGALMETGEMETIHGIGTAKAAGLIYGAVKSGEARKPSFLSLATFTAQQKIWRKSAGCEDVYDYKYWKGKGWLEKDCTYYIRHNAGALKGALSRLAGRLIAAFFM